MSYAQYREMLKRMTPVELEVELKKVRASWHKAGTNRAKLAWKTMIDSVEHQQRQNADASMKLWR